MKIIITAEEIDLAIIAYAKLQGLNCGPNTTVSLTAGRSANGTFATIDTLGSIAVVAPLPQEESNIEADSEPVEQSEEPERIAASRSVFGSKTESA